MKRLLLACFFVAGCKNHAQEADDRHELANEILATAGAFGDAICACADADCARKVSERFEKWTHTASSEIAALERKQGETVTADQNAIDEAFDRYEKCSIRFAIGRPPAL